MSDWFAPTWFTTKTKSGTILVSNWRQDWRPGQEVGNPLKSKPLCPMSKWDRQHGGTPTENHLAQARRLRVIYCGPARGYTDDGEGQVLPVSGHEVEVEIIE
jgi:hypothetical protein